MKLHGVPASPDAQAGGGTEGKDTLNLGAWYQRGSAGAGEEGAEFTAGIFDRFREADALGYDNDGDQTEN